MASQYIRRALNAPWPALAAIASQRMLHRITWCDASEETSRVNPANLDKSTTTKDVLDNNLRVKPAGMRPDDKGDFHGLFPKRQLFQPRLEYPLWDANWDDHHHHHYHYHHRPESSPSVVDHLSDEEKRQHVRHLRKNGVTRHIILIRHGQYDENHKEDEKKILTELGRTQAELTGKRLADMMRGVDETIGPCRVKVLRVSNLARAIETADIIARHLPGVERAEPDPLLNEGRPSHHIPCEKASASVIQKTDEGHQRIEQAFQKYFYRSDKLAEKSGGDEKVKDEDKHEFEIIVCHGNVIRYFMCRALQIPPEAWLRLCTFNCSLTYLTIRPTGSVSCRMLGDIGHLPKDKSTFSMHHGFNW